MQLNQMHGEIFIYNQTASGMCDACNLLHVCNKELDTCNRTSMHNILCNKKRIDTEHTYAIAY